MVLAGGATLAFFGSLVMGVIGPIGGIPSVSFRLYYGPAPFARELFLEFQDSFDESFRPCFELECRALRRVRDTMGLTNVAVMVPFVRSVAEARQHGSGALDLASLDVHAIRAELDLDPRALGRAIREGQRLAQPGEGAPRITGALLGRHGGVLQDARARARIGRGDAQRHEIEQKLPAVGLRRGSREAPCRVLVAAGKRAA